ncbi:MAG: N-(5'-phosphoribosyl)anthranilate isomerase [Acidimicrobiia bacterium]
MTVEGPATAAATAGTWVKVCGVRTRGDVVAAAEAGADAFGLVMAPSPRQVDAEQAATLVRLSTGLDSFLVTVDARPAELLDLARFVGVSGVQPHGRYAAEAASAGVQAGLLVLRPRPVSGVVELDDIPSTQIPLLDTAAGEAHGGTGRRFDWDLAAAITRRYVLAGGLGPDTVAEAVARLHPWGVDASSGLESAPGVKDAHLIRRYVQEAKTS